MPFARREKTYSSLTGKVIPGFALAAVCLFFLFIGCLPVYAAYTASCAVLGQLPCE